MKRLVIVGMFFLSFNLLIAQEHRLVKIWETDTLLKTPESVLFNAAGKFLYVSNINGQAADKDGNGSIGKVALDGKIIAVDWAKGLNAPKGMGVYKTTLWVADIDEVVGINTTTGAIEKRIKIPGASFLNDITIDNKGIVYVSDSGGKKVYAIENGNVTTVQDYLHSPNGLFAAGDDLYILDNGSLMKLGKDKKLTKVADGMESSTDGLEMVDDKDFIVSCWGGTIYYIKADGSKQKLLDTRAQKINSADIGFDAVKKIVYVPTFAKNSITAYALK